MKTEQLPHMAMQEPQVSHMAGRPHRVSHGTVWLHQMPLVAVQQMHVREQPWVYLHGVENVTDQWGPTQG